VLLAGAAAVTAAANQVKPAPVDMQYGVNERDHIPGNNNIHCVVLPCCYYQHCQQHSSYPSSRLHRPLTSVLIVGQDTCGSTAPGHRVTSCCCCTRAQNDKLLLLHQEAGGPG
jgi:hypothetical protein